MAQEKLDNSRNGNVSNPNVAECLVWAGRAADAAKYPYPYLGVILAEISTRF